MNHKQRNSSHAEASGMATPAEAIDETVATHYRAPRTFSFRGAYSRRRLLATCRTFPRRCQRRTVGCSAALFNLEGFPDSSASKHRVGGLVPGTFAVKHVSSRIGGGYIGRRSEPGTPSSGTGYGSQQRFPFVTVHFVEQTVFRSCLLL